MSSSSEPTMTIAVGTYDAATRTVPATFTLGDVVHSRSVNAVLNDKGNYDRKATRARVEEVGLGVAVKIGAGVITLAPEEPAAEETAPPSSPE